MDGKEQALGDRKCLYLITSRCSSFILVLLYSINMFINYRFLVILQACVMFFVSPSRISSFRWNDRPVFLFGRGDV